jgi:hypothetical protein
MTPEIDNCLAYTVLHHPDEWLGSPSTSYLQALLIGAELRAAVLQTELAGWRVYGVLDEPEFYGQFVAATGRPMLTIKWATALAMTHFSLAEGFAKLRDEAMAWHRLHGVTDDRSIHPWESQAGTPNQIADLFWSRLAERPGVFLGDTRGWSLFCFLNGMDRGGDWLGLPEMPRLREVLDRISSSSKRAYGSTFAAYRVYDAPALLEWAGLSSTQSIKP